MFYFALLFHFTLQPYAVIFCQVKTGPRYFHMCSRAPPGPVVFPLHPSTHRQYKAPNPPPHTPRLSFTAKQVQNSQSQNSVDSLRTLPKSTPTSSPPAMFKYRSCRSSIAVQLAPSVRLIAMGQISFCTSRRAPTKHLRATWVITRRTVAWRGNDPLLRSAVLANKNS